MHELAIHEDGTDVLVYRMATAFPKGKVKNK